MIFISASGKESRMMKIWKPLLCSLLALVSALFLCACGQTKGITDAISQHTPDNTYTLSLRAGSLGGVLSGKIDGNVLIGEPVGLSSPPFVEDGIFYFPLQDVAALLGGTCVIEDDTATVHLFGHTMQFQATSEELTLDGELVPEGTDPGIGTDGSVPQMIDGIFYLPSRFRAEDCITGFNCSTPYLDEDMVILSNAWDHRYELGAAGAYLEEPFDQVPEELKDTLILQETECAENSSLYNYEHFAGEGIDLWVARLRDGLKDAERLNGTILAIQLTGDRYSTTRGLRTGDDLQRVTLLYGPLEWLGFVYSGGELTLHFDETNCVDRISFVSVYCDAALG